MSHTPLNSQARPQALHLSTASLALRKARQHIKGLFVHKRAHSGVETETCDVATLSSDHSSSASSVSSSPSSLSKRQSRSDASSLLPSGTISAHNLPRLFVNAEKDVSPQTLGPSSSVSHSKRRITLTEGENGVDSREFECSPHPLKKLRRDYSEKLIESDIELDDSIPKIRTHSNGTIVPVHPRPPSCIPSAQSRWQSPHTSPLGPKTSKYVRRSRSGYFPMAPCKAAPNLPIRCLSHEFMKDNRNRNPASQHPQWCDDLFVSGLQRYLHPQYKCSHRYHPCDPEYYEDQCESDIDIDLSDDEDDDDDYDCLPTPRDPEEDAKMQVAIHSTEEHRPQPDTIKVDRETYPWTKWQESAGSIQSITSRWGMDEIESTDVAMQMAIST